MRQLWMIYYYLPPQRNHKLQIGRLIESFVKEWTQNITKEVSVIQNRIAIHGNTIFIQDKRVCVKPLRSRLEAIQKLQPPTTVKLRDVEIVQKW